MASNPRSPRKLPVFESFGNQPRTDRRVGVHSVIRVTIGWEEHEADRPYVRAAMFTPAQVEALQRMWKAMRAYAQSANQRGREAGTDILIKLCAGEATVGEFNEVAQGKKG